MKQVFSSQKTSAGILAYRRGKLGLEVLLVHPGGPFWRNKEDGAWSIPKGEMDASEDPEQTARREFAEELGPAASIGPLKALGEIRQRAGKRVIAFCGEGDFDPTMLSSNTFEIEWPPRSGRLQAFPEVDRAEWFDLETAKKKLLPAQIDLIARLSIAKALTEPSGPLTPLRPVCRWIIPDRKRLGFVHAAWRAKPVSSRAEKCNFDI